MFTILAFALVVGACAQSLGDGPVGLDEVPELPSSTTWTTLRSCAEYESVTAPADAYRDEPIYVANEMPVEEVQSWASTQPGYETVWIDRDHNGWISVAFSMDIKGQQTALEDAFPGVGVVAVQVDWSLEELLNLQSRANEAVGQLTDSWSTGVSQTRGVVEVGVSVLTDEIRTEFESQFAGERLCLVGADPSTVFPAGPQPTEGDHWRLLVDEQQVGHPYRTGIATDAESLEALWGTIGLDTPIPDVNFESEIVVWFGAVYSGSCPDIQLDDVIVAGSTLHADIIMVGPAPVACTADANARAYVVAVERAVLPKGPFVIQLDVDGPPAGAPEERTIVDADLSIPGSVADPGQVGFDTSPPESHAVESGDTIEPDYPVDYRLHTRCGIEWLGELNDVNWRTDESVPAEWQGLAGGNDSITVSVLLTVSPTPFIAATAGESTITYAPSTDPIPPCL